MSDNDSGVETLDDEHVYNDVARRDIEREFPDAFYDPTTGQIMTEPVVNPIGDSYDKSTMVDLPVTFYPNRALQAIIAREVEMASVSFRGSLRRIDESVRSTLSNAVSKVGFGRQVRPLPASFYCPITCDLIVDPVISPDGNSYERAAIVKWLSEHDVSPITRNPLSLSVLRPNNTLYKLIQHEKSESMESQHPSIRRWQESGMDTSSRHTLGATIVSRTDQASTTTPASTSPQTLVDLSFVRTPAMRRRERLQGFKFVSCLVSMIMALVFIPRPFSYFVVLAVFDLGLLAICCY